MLVVSETAMAVVLVVGAGLMLKSFWMVNRVEPGFNAEGLVTMRLSPPSSRYGDGASLSDYYDRVFERLQAVPGVASVGANILLPMGPGGIAVLYDVEDDILPEGEHRPRANVRSVSAGYFQMMEIPLAEGRLFNDADGTDESLAMILNETMAQDLAPDGTALGKRIGGFFGETFTVVGVVADVHQQSLQVAPRPEMYIPYRWWTTSNMYVLVRTRSEPNSQIPMLQQAVWSVDADVPISRISTMEDVVARSLGDSRFLTQLLTAFASLALVLGAIGVYGVLSYTVNQRASELGVRMALGAPQNAVLKSALAQGVGLVAGGVLVGIAVALVAARLLSRFLFGVSTTDPTTFVSVGVFLLLVAAVASLTPAIRASRIDPIVALRLE
jgi:predicted permease